MGVPTPQGCVGCNLPDPEYPPALVTCMFCAMVLTIVVDLIGNSMVILAVTKNEKLRNSGNILVVSLSMADMLVAIYPYPLMLHAMSAGEWDLGPLQCQMVGLVTGLSVVGSVFNIMAIAINRYCYICHSLQYERIFSVRNTCIYTAVTWIMTVLAVLPNMYIGTIDYDPRSYTCTFNYGNSPVFTVTIVCIHFVLPLLIVGFCYIRIWNKVLEAQNQAGQNPDNHLAEVRNFLTMFVIFLLFAVCWCPINVLTIVVAVGPKEMASKIPNWLYLAAYFIAYFDSCLNAIIYGLLNESFRREYWTIFHAMRHPILFLSGLLNDVHEMREARDLVRARVRARDQAREQEHARACLDVEGTPLNVRNVLLPGDASASHPDRASVHPMPHARSASAYRKPASTYHKSGHPKSATVYPKQASSVRFKPASVHFQGASVRFQGDSVHFQGESVRFQGDTVHFQGDSVRFKPAPKCVTHYHVSGRSAISYPEVAAGYIEPLTVDYLEPATTSFSVSTAAGHPEMSASRYPEVTAPGHFKPDITELTEFPSTSAMASPKPGASQWQCAAALPHSTKDYHEVMVIDDSDDDFDDDDDSDEIAV